MEQKEGIQIDIEHKTIKGYLLKKGKPLKQRLKEQMEQLKDAFMCKMFFGIPQSLKENKFTESIY